VTLTVNSWEKMTENQQLPLRSRNRTGTWGSIPGGGSQSAGAPGMPEPAEGTRTALRSSVRLTHWSTRLCSRSKSCSDLSTHTRTPCTVISLFNARLEEWISLHWIKFSLYEGFVKLDLEIVHLLTRHTICNNDKGIYLDK
jgi:hypothetical protein